MARYVARNVKSYEDDEEDWYDEFPMLNVPFVDDSALQPTGLLNSDGVPLWRLPPPIGFGRDTEW